VAPGRLAVRPWRVQFAVCFEAMLAYVDGLIGPPRSTAAKRLARPFARPGRALAWPPPQRPWPTAGAVLPPVSGWPTRASGRREGTLTLHSRAAFGCPHVKARRLNGLRLPSLWPSGPRRSRLGARSKLLQDYPQIHARTHARTHTHTHTHRHTHTHTHTHTHEHTNISSYLLLSLLLRGSA
jgi:hypothetical protein